MEVNNISCSSADSTKDDDVMLPGFRFHPTDEELVGFYLKRKVDKKPFSIELIRQIDIYKYDPWDLPKTTTAGDKEWYFFCIRGRKYRNSVRPNRVTKSGFWKATGIDKPIYSVKEPHECIGLKKSLVYYRGSAGKGTKTDWMMHEFRLPPDGYGKNSDQLLNAKINVAQEAEVWTLCRIFKRASSYKRYTPDWKETNHRQNLGNSNSKTCSLEYETSEKYLTFDESCNGIRQNECKPVNHLIDQGSIMFMDTNMNSITQPSPMATYSSFYHPYTGEVFDNGNWDELSSVVELANGNSPFQFQFQGYRCT